MCIFFFFFQAEDGIRDKLVTGVQTCALPILRARRRMSSASSSSSSRVTVGSPRRASAARTCWGEARRSLRSITPLLLRESELETAVAAVLVDEDLEVQATRHRVHGQHAQLGVERERHAERA